MSSHRSGQKGQVQSRTTEANAGADAGATVCAAFDAGEEESCMRLARASSMPIVRHLSRVLPEAGRTGRNVHASGCYRLLQRGVMRLRGEPLPRSRFSRSAKSACATQYVRRAVTQCHPREPHNTFLANGLRRQRDRQLGMDIVFAVHLDELSGAVSLPSCSAEPTSHACAPLRVAASRSARLRMPPAPIKVRAPARLRIESKVSRSGPS